MNSISPHDRVVEPQNHEPEAVRDWYADNPLTHADRRRADAASEWVRSFSCEDMRPLIVCRGPVRKEAMDVFREMGMTGYGILLSEKDSIVYANSLAPELRQIDPAHVHRVPDYTGATKEEREARIDQIIDIAISNGYDYIFAGYGFMAEDEAFVRKIEAAGLNFMGPCSRTVQAAGRKDEAKRTAVAKEVSVTPGVNDVVLRALLAKHPKASDLKALADKHGLSVSDPAADGPVEAQAEALLEASYSADLDLLEIEEIGARVRTEVTEMFRQYPNNRVRLKAIGGGGGKGQRILAGPASFGDGPLEERIEKAAAGAPGMYREVLSEVKATGPGDNKNVLLELNIERTRHNEIQLLGNGEWCIALGGRDCSLQMHEQKLLEVSMTQEALQDEIKAARERGDEKIAVALKEDLETLRRMEAEAERFGEAVGLDSVSTFECIVEDDHHFFMEVNTRIQVEHRVTELCYTLRFRNPFNMEDYFDVDSLVEAMALMAKHKKRLPRPERKPRKGAAVEARLNATDDALQPHAGGTIVNWTDPIEGEIRDDQGICIKNPDTNLFMRYTVAGAYDSNIALLVTHGESRAASYERLNEILRLSRLRGKQLATNLEFHYGLINWFRARHVYAKPTTRFVMPYLTQVALLKQEAEQIDVSHAFEQITKRYETSVVEALPEGTRKPAMERVRELMSRKHTLLERPVSRLLGCPHILSGWLSNHKDDFVLDNGRLRWTVNPVEVLAETYQVLNMEYQADAAPAQVIWEHDEKLLRQSLEFYDDLHTLLGDALRGDHPGLVEVLERPEPPKGIDASMWAKIRSAHRGHQLGIELLALIALTGVRSKFFEIRLLDDLTIHIPERLQDPALQDKMKKVLVPPPATKADEIVAISGGMYYAQEAPGLPPLIQKGDHFEKGQPIYLIEVMKMFNKVLAPFSGTIDEVLIEGDGTIVSKGQPIFRVTPDEKLVEEDPSAKRQRILQHTESYLEQL